MEAILHTSAGDIHLELYPQSAPVTVKNFVDLATGARQWTHPMTGEVSTEPLYNGTVFHRVIDGFMIQGGDPIGTGTGGPGYVFDDEIDPALGFTEPYLLAMANAGTRGGRGTNGSQFFITVAPTTWLNGKHTIFGRVVDDASRAVVDAIATVATDHSDRPLDDVMIETIEISE
ncbi:peptidylprolyl isomerase [Mobiluncus porci]|uniref:Peptidyl-prolyl cis-trans isomerase n=1 Tax=Mobiluncus porci TaxID=2652278 RepID=A0A7K0K0Q8_9ACTO|nr:peptidylprolyl isomerase [Mobiluncus porci]MST49072.1 peptidylprolyl isomerase [Mobiluncus porci]